jgi:hypothetical protein
MDYHSMNLLELKQAAKNHLPKIKQYYIKTRVELIKILLLSDFPEQMIVEKKTIAELRKEAQAKKLPNIWKLRRSELVELLYPSTNQYDQDNKDGQKHDNPKQSQGD